MNGSSVTKSYDKLVYFLLGLVMGFIVGVCVVKLVSDSDGTTEDKGQPATSTTTTTEETEVAETENAFDYEGFVNGEIIEEKKFKVNQVLLDNVALVNGDDGFSGMYMGVTYLMVGPKGTTFYDDQIIKVPKGKVVRMNGTYQYETRMGIQKTVPQIMIMDK